MTKIIEVQPRDCAVCNVRLERVRDYSEWCSAECKAISAARAEQVGTCRDCNGPTRGMFCLNCWKQRAGDLYPARDIRGMSDEQYWDGMADAQSY